MDEPIVMASGRTADVLVLDEHHVLKLFHATVSGQSIQDEFAIGERENIYQVTTAQKQLQQSRKVVDSPRAVPFLVERELFYQTVDGSVFSIFMKVEQQYYLVPMAVYKNGEVVCYVPGRDIHFRIEEVSDWFTEQTFFTELNEPTSVILPELGEVTLSDGGYAAALADKRDELIDSHKKLNGVKTSFEECREAYYQYLEDPREYYRQALKEKYERVPEHERMYLGDMDSKDWDYQRIIYRPDEKREV
ncbi:hypothetical protein PA598K_06327 [Paenibacillus sp. 598K]|uniref:DUF7638 domain-containing protein n=1 Tax=Paenibacillus sp. 598K TaxID=1117987 RepID=UPI000FF95539|nr:hypothetical protein [Paenibacillus sp. 598K]GBF77761.1 hypothetical protein PA598K_06327 [Paenibacillus sp. 598K]